jgi:hypothetical protein
MSERGATTITVVIVDAVVMTPGYHLASLIFLPTQCLSRNDAFHFFF